MNTIAVQLQTYIVDSFTRVPFRGNPAAVCLLTEAIDDPPMQSIATEFGFSETAFLLGDRIRFLFPEFPREDLQVGGMSQESFYSLEIAEYARDSRGDR